MGVYDERKTALWGQRGFLSGCVFKASMGLKPQGFSSNSKIGW